MAIRDALGRRLRSRTTPRPARVVVAAFAFVIFLGTIVLWLPISATSGTHTNIIDALFTATSAVCVTGLVSVDTATHWSGFGQVVIMVLIQIGGLGIMIMATLIGIILSRRLSMQSRILLATESRGIDSSDVRRVVKSIVLISLGIEAAVFVVLFPRFLFGYDYDLGEAAWHALFHSVSSFNNAGFALYSNNLVDFAADPWICLPLCAAIILGGLGFPVLMQLRREWRRPLLWSLTTRIMMWGTVLLLLIGTIFITAVEWNNPQTLGAYDPATRVLIGFFQSVQTRTAGFNTVDVGLLHDETWVGMDVLMFIGGGPAGTAGGIKVTTFAVLFFVLITELRGEGAVNAFGKRISRAVHRQAIAVVLLSIGAIMASTIALMMITGLPLDRVLFESISAFATVGLSTGITYDLPPQADMILAMLMFLGRLGPLTLGAALALRERRILYEYPLERPAIG